MFDSTEIGGTMDEIIAFGTTVDITPAAQNQLLAKLSLSTDLRRYFV